MNAKQRVRVRHLVESGAIRQALERADFHSADIEDIIVELDLATRDAHSKPTQELIAKMIRASY